MPRAAPRPDRSTTGRTTARSHPGTPCRTSGGPAPHGPATGGIPAAAVLTAIRRIGAPFRDEVVTATGLSHATVNRQIVALVEAGLVRERPDLVRAGTIGRPRVPIEIDQDRFGVLGLHVGVHRTTLAIGDLRGTVLAAAEVPTPHDTGPAEAFGLLAEKLCRFGVRFAERTLLQVGLVVGGQAPDGRGAARSGWNTAPVADVARRLALPDVVVVPQIEAVAGAESLLAPHVDEGSTLHVYAREAVGAVLTVHGRVHGPSAGAGTISHLPVGGDVPCPCGRTGCLEASVGDAAVAATAHAAGLVDAPLIEKVVAAAEGGDLASHDLLVGRARLLGRGVALVRDILNPDRVLLAGQAFTAYRPGLAHVSESFSRATSLGPTSLQVTTFGPALQAVAACTAALRPVYADPLAAVRTAAARHDDPTTPRKANR